MRASQRGWTVLMVAAGLLCGDVLAGCFPQLCDGEPNDIEIGTYVADDSQGGPLHGASVQVEEDIVTIREEGSSGAVVATYRVVERKRRDSP